MALTGLAFPNVEHIVFVALVAFVGTINPSTGDLGVLVPIEHAMLAQSASDHERTRTFARYSLIGALSMAAGSLGRGGAGFSRRCRHRHGQRVQADVLRLCGVGRGERAALPAAARTRRWMRRATTAPLGPSRGVVYKLSALFSLDAFAGGFVVQSLLALWLFERFDLSLSAASVFFFWSSTASAFSYPVAAWLAARIGLINTMVFTHIPSSILLIVAAFSPNLY